MVHPAGTGKQRGTAAGGLTLLYHLPVELHAMAEQLRQRLALLGCELTLLFTTLKLGRLRGSGAGRPDDERPSDRRSAGYATEQWLRCDMLWPNLLTGAQYAHLQATLDAVQSQPDARSRNDALRNVFNSLMEDAIMTPLFKYNYRISAPPGVNGLRLNARGWFDFASAAAGLVDVRELVMEGVWRYHIAFIHLVRNCHETRRSCLQRRTRFNHLSGAGSATV